MANEHLALVLGGVGDPGQALLGDGDAVGLQGGGGVVPRLGMLVLAGFAWPFLLLTLAREDDILFFLVLSHSGVHSSLAGLCVPGVGDGLGGVVGGSSGASCW